MDEITNSNYIENVSLEFLEQILKNLPTNIFFKDLECKYVFSTHYWKHIKVSDNENWNIKGKTDLEIRKDNENAKKALEVDKAIIKNGVGTKYVIEYTEDGVLEYLEIIKNPVFDKNGNIIGIVGMINDVTQKVLQEKELEFMATQDKLTGLYNRSYFDKFYNNENKDEIYPLAVVMADCNNLKKINDNYGHFAGDEYIKKSASIFKIVLPDYTYIFRMGGDEFLALIPNTNERQAAIYIDKMKKLSKRIKIKGQELSIAFGSTIVSSIKKDLSEDINLADEKMYSNKVKNHKTRVRR